MNQGANKKREAKLRERCEVLAGVLVSVGGLYHNESTTKDQKAYLETMIGAALWYLPVPKECWTGKISLEAIRAHHPDSGVQRPKLTADHEYPRKIAAGELLGRHAGERAKLSDELLPLYVGKYGRFNYVTPQENRSLMPHQRRSAFVDPATAYLAAGITLVAVTEGELSQIKKRNAAAIARVLQRL
ncbi:hypothetical protein GBA63_08930 [Rubrobacter tropicus]|uniref:Uncharacterized protein n=1 Tax=Rubrobacter tropicus TaxID=2653851 RepID=A0A6G8Q8W6_9ACTN|nr:hypothetical protein [Rubrobacter tropicus]QIN82757.1 hypothetical protein GBA63_08930 [Rubrobacter tropicus]